MPDIRMDDQPFSRRKKKKPNTIRVVDETPKIYSGSICPTNLSQEKERFLKYGILPQFVLRASSSQVEAMSSKPLGRVSHTLFDQALRVLKLVKDKFGYGEEYFHQAFGERIDVKTASSLLTQYLNEHGLDGQISIVFSADLDCSARMMWHGPHVKQNRPEARRHTLIIKNSPDNFYLRERGIICLANHEIGTHYLRTLNEGLQPWFSDRGMFSLRSVRHYTSKKTEEGLAALHTILEARSRFLFAPALLYYISCMAEKMTFKELFQHLEEFIQDPERRWHYVMRVKRHLPDPNDLGGFGKDQCYFEGIVEILQNVDNLDLPLIYAGSLCMDETSRVKRLARQDCLKLPNFLRDTEAYRQQLRWIGYVNGILPKPQPRKIKVKRSTTSLRSQQGPRPALKDKTLQRNKISSVIGDQAPSNMVFIGNEEQTTPDSTDSASADSSMDCTRAPAACGTVNNHQGASRDVLKPVQSGRSNHCILDKLSTRLTFHDSLVKRVESKLNSAALSLKQSERLMVDGLKGRRGLAVVTPPALSPQSSSDSLILRLGRRQHTVDEGHYTVHASSPSRRAGSFSSDSANYT